MNVSKKAIFANVENILEKNVKYFKYILNLLCREKLK